jgi:hypothetical protein
MPPAFVLSQNQTLKFMTDNHPGGKPEEEAGISGSRSCTSHILWICNETCKTSHQSCTLMRTYRNGLVCPIHRHPEVTGNRGRRPHVPSSKPTMSKSRRVFPPLYPGRPVYRLRRRRRGWATPCPAGGSPYMEEISYRQWLFSTNSFEAFAPDDGPLPALPATRPAQRMSALPVASLRETVEKTAARGPRQSWTKIGGNSPPSRPAQLNFQRLKAGSLERAVWTYLARASPAFKTRPAFYRGFSDGCGRTASRRRRAICRCVSRPSRPF